MGFCEVGITFRFDPSIKPTVPTGERSRSRRAEGPVACQDATPSRWHT